MPKNKSHKGLLKRIRITKTGKVKFMRACGRHLKSKKAGTLVQQYRSPTYAKAADAGRLSAMLNRHVRSDEDHQREKERKRTAKAVPVKSKK